MVDIFHMRHFSTFVLSYECELFSQSGNGKWTHFHFDSHKGLALSASIVIGFACIVSQGFFKHTQNNSTERFDHF